MGSTYNLIANICFGLSATLLITAIILFFVLKISRVIGYFTGKTERKSIEQMRMEKENKVAGFNYADKVQSDGIRNITAGITGGITENITNSSSTTGRLEEYAPYSSDNGTVALGSTEQVTTLLNDTQGTTVLSEPQGTTVLSEVQGTTVLSEEQGTSKLKMIKNVIIIHTTENIA